MGGIVLKKITRLFSVALLCICVSIILVGCGTGSDKSDTNSSNPGEGGKKKFIVATDATYAPMEYMDEKGNIVGIDIEIVKAIAEAAGIEVEFKNYGTDLEIIALEESISLLGHAVPFNEPIVTQGPFVMNSSEEIRQAYHDYSNGKFGN